MHWGLRKVWNWMKNSKKPIFLIIGELEDAPQEEENK